MTTNTQHYEFETWHAANFDYKITFYSKNDDGSYINQNLRHDYEIWQAALASQPAQDALPQAMECGGNGPIDANKLEAIAKERPDDFFLKGSGVLKLTGAIRQLEREIRSLKDVAQPPAQPAIDAVKALYSGRAIELKTDPKVFQDVLDGRKPFELRWNDRDYQIGDDLLLRETTNTGAEIKAGAFLLYTGRETTRRIGYLLADPIYGLAEGWVIAAFDGSPLPSTPVSAQQVLSDEEIKQIWYDAKDGYLGFARALLQKAGASGRDDYKQIARLIGIIYFAGDFVAETPNERRLEELLIKVGCRYQSWKEIDALPSPDNVDAQRTGDE